jgi:hypothetical protein
MPLARNLRLFYLYCDASGKAGVFEAAFIRENAGFADFLDYNESSADFNFKERSNTRTIQRPYSNEKESSDMKRTIFVMLAVVALAVTTGCLKRQCRENGCTTGGCSVAEPSCCDRGCTMKDPGHERCRLLRDRGCEQAAPAAPAAGPATGAVAYPYYNLRGPRDFLERNPQSIGP